MKTREIEFRAKSIHKSNEGVFVYGVPYENEHGDWQMLKKGERMYSIDPETIGEYTGLKDKNGKKIYEGDVLIHNTKEYINGAVSFFEGAFIVGTCVTSHALINFNVPKNIEVIGNIHESI
jgi:uncharacterized phage protein (TIGR01671 family)